MKFSVTFWIDCVGFDMYDLFILLKAGSVTHDV